jgi:cobalt/nickel transport system ATP-binding protein
VAGRLINLRGVRFAYDGGAEVLAGVDFSLSAGERAALLGPNGSGKTTLLHVLVGLLWPSAGEVEAFGAVRRREADFHDVRRRAGLLFQDVDDQLFCPTVEEDVAFGPLNLGASRDDVRGLVADTLASLGLAGYGPRITYKLSGGEKRMVALATVLAMRPDVLLLDEPTAELDAPARRRLIDILAGRGEAMLLATHDLEMVRELCGRAGVLSGGRIAAAGPTGEILADEGLLARCGVR